MIPIEMHTSVENLSRGIDLGKLGKIPKF